MTDSFVEDPINRQRSRQKGNPLQTMRLPGHFLVKGVNSAVVDHDGDSATADPSVVPLLLSNVSLSFWGGIDPITGIVIDATHPLAGKSVVDTILCIPSGRGSCTASQVLLELILNNKAPRALVLRDVDGLACVGALVAQEILRCPRTLDIIHVGDDVYRELLGSGAAYGSVLSDGQLVIGDNDEIVRSEAQEAQVQSVNTATSPPESIEVNKFTEDEERLLENSRSEGERMALRVIFRFARLSSDTPSYLPVAKAHIDGKF
jgi:predicted aconitase with swiveling domain